MRPVDKTLWRTFSGDTTHATTRQFLIETLGGYCSYCEAPLGDDLPIEHKAPQKDFFDFSKRYGNLLLACSACNTAKGARPTAADGKAFYKANKGNLPRVNPDDLQQLYWLSVLTMAWPDALSGRAYDVGAIPPDLEKLLWGTGHWDATLNMFRYSLEMVSQVALEQDGLLHFKTTDNRNAPWATKQRQIVTVRPNTSLVGLAPQRATKTILTLNLNYDNPDDDTAPDRRVQNRTATWAVALSGLSALTRAVQIKAQNPFWDGGMSPLIRNVVKILRQSASLTGHWSVWATVFQPLVEAAVSPWQGMKTKTRMTGADYYSALFMIYLAEDDARKLYAFQPDPIPIFIGTDVERANY